MKLSAGTSNESEKQRNLTAGIEANISVMNRELPVDRCFDIIFRRFEAGGRKACLYGIDGFIKDDTLLRIMQGIMNLKPENLPKTPEAFLNKLIPYGEASVAMTVEEVTQSVFMGMSCIFVDGYTGCFVIDCRTYPARSVDEPMKEKVLRGSRDGFVETIVFNTALIRRRIRDVHLITEITQLGDASKTDLAICYMDDRVDHQLLTKIKERIKSITVDALTMNQESLAECLYPGKWFNPFPKFKYTERPDTTAAHILEGNIVILVDNSPSAMILPSSVFDILEEADDYYFPPITGTYLRLSRTLITFMAMLLTPLWLLLMQNTHWIPEWLSFIQIKDEINIPIIFQLLILELAIDGLRLASLNTPSMLTTPLSVIAALVIGEFSVNSGWFNSETMLYMAFVALSNYTQSSFELGYAIKFIRIILLILTAIFNLWGFIAGVALMLGCIVFNKTIAGKSYIYPLIPFSWRELKRRLFRIRLEHR